MTAFPLFKGATRAATKGGVPLPPLLFMLMFVGSVAILVSLWGLVLAPILWATMAAITRHDDRAFRIWGLWLETQARNRNKRIWRASSYAPASYRRH